MKNKNVIYLIAVLTAVAAIFFFYKRAAAQRKIKKTTGKNPNIPQFENIYLDDIVFPVKMGAKGKEILYIQCLMNIEDSKDLSLDGILGPKTWSAMKEHYWGPAVFNYTNEFSKHLYDIEIAPKMGKIKEYLTKQGLKIV